MAAVHRPITGRRAAAGCSWHNVAMGGRILYLVGGAPRVGKSVLAQRLLETEGIPWLPTDAVRTVLRRVLPEFDAADHDPVDAAQLAKYMYPHIEQVAGVCAEEAERFLIEGFELSPWYRGRLEAALDGTRVRACFLGHSTFSADDLAAYRGPKPQHEGEASRAELTEAAAPSWAGCGCATWTRDPRSGRALAPRGEGFGAASECQDRRRPDNAWRRRHHAEW
jgi:predicted kinase